MLPQLPHGYRTRPVALSDAEAVAAIISGDEIAATGRSATGPETVLGDWHGVDLAEDAVLVVDGEGHAAAYADLVDRAHEVISVYGYVSPEHRERGLGAWLVGWGEEKAGERAPFARPEVEVTVRHYVNTGKRSFREWLEARGYRAEREVHVMGVDLPSPVARPVIPEGIAIRPIRPGIDDDQAFAQIEKAFRDHWGRPPGSRERFDARFTAPGFQPWSILLAWDGDHIAGQCWTTVADGQGWIESVGVSRAWRRRGVASALLAEMFAQLHARGVPRVELSVDSQSGTGAPGVYRGAGMEVVSAYTVLQKTVREGSRS